MFYRRIIVDHLSILYTCMLVSILKSQGVAKCSSVRAMMGREPQSLPWELRPGPSEADSE